MDEKDYKIIVELQRNARQSDAQIARALGIGETSVRRRIARLIKDKVIRVTVVPNPESVGLEVMSLFLIEADLSTLQHVCRLLYAMPMVYYLSVLTGRFNVIFSAAFRSREELSKFMETDLATVPGINRFESLLEVEILKWDQKILPDNQRDKQELKSRPLIFQSGKRKLPVTTIDQRDYEIIRELQRDARQAESAVARKLGLSEKTVWRRIKKLIENQVINITVVEHPQKLGFETAAIIGICTAVSMLEDVAKRLVTMPRCHYVALTTGHFDLIMFVTFRSLGELVEFIKDELCQINGIVSTETFYCLDIKKRELGILPPQFP